MVTAALASPIIIGGGYLTLDALLASILFEELQDVDAAHAAIPIVKSDEVFHASAAILEPIHTENISFVANLRADHALDADLLLKNRHGRIHRKLGRKRRQDYGAVMNRYKALTVDEVTWFAEGDGPQIDKLLKGTGFIGKRRGSGFGEVTEWKIEPAGYNGVLGPSNQPMRPVPVELFTGDKGSLKVDAAWRPAYWHPENRAICYAPELVT